MKALFGVKWWRIVLGIHSLSIDVDQFLSRPFFSSDEAHTIKNRGTKSAKACFELEGNHRWCLTGTPM